MSNIHRLESMTRGCRPYQSQGKGKGEEKGRKKGKRNDELKISESKEGTIEKRFPRYRNV